MKSFLAGVGLGALFLTAALLLCDHVVFGAEGPAAKGERITLSARPSCKTCHSPKLNPLAGVGERLEDQEIKDWIRKPAAMFKKAGKRGKMPTYRFTDDELEAVVAYLKAL
jgi:mono/diheme cytochrome c family protein